VTTIFEEISFKVEFMFNNFLRGTSFQLYKNSELMKPEEVQEDLIMQIRRDIKTLGSSKFEGLVRTMEGMFRDKLQLKIGVIKEEEDRMIELLRKENEELSRPRELKQSPRAKNKKKVNENQSSEIKPLETKNADVYTMA
jgi:hypothetical protein